MGQAFVFYATLDILFISSAFARLVQKDDGPLLNLQSFEIEIVDYKSEW